MAASWLANSDTAPHKIVSGVLPRVRPLPRRSSERIISAQGMFGTNNSKTNSTATVSHFDWSSRHLPRGVAWHVVVARGGSRKAELHPLVQRQQNVVRQLLSGQGQNPIWLSKARKRTARWSLAPSEERTRAIIRSTPLQSDDKLETPRFQLVEMLPLQVLEWPKLPNGHGT